MSRTAGDYCCYLSIVARTGRIADASVTLETLPAPKVETSRKLTLPGGAVFVFSCMSFSRCCLLVGGETKSPIKPRSLIGIFLVAQLCPGRGKVFLADVPRKSGKSDNAGFLCLGGENSAAAVDPCASRRCGPMVSYLFTLFHEVSMSVTPLWMYPVPR